jgi:serine/threonine-protein kinase
MKADAKSLARPERSRYAVVVADVLGPPAPPLPPPKPAPTVRAGDVIAGRFKVERVLGKGGMGVVVAAVHLELERLVALKFLLPEAASHPEFVLRFSREAKAAAKIRSEHSVKVIDVGALPSGLPYMVMEYLDGEDLKQVVTRLGTLGVETATGYVLQACEALAEAHHLGIVHRDLKPANLFLSRASTGEPLIKVLDFGISKTAQSDVQLTQDATLMGSPNYISPEQLTSAKSVDPRSDIWSLGVILYELLSGVKPFQSGSMSEFVMTILQRPHKPVRDYRPEVPEELAAVIDRCLEKEPQRRFASVAELAQALAPFGPPGSEASVRNVMRSFGASPSAGPPARPSSSRPSAPPRPGPPPGPDGAATPGGAQARAGGPMPSADVSTTTGIVVSVLAFGLMLALGILMMRGRGSPSSTSIAGPAVSSTMPPTTAGEPPTAAGRAPNTTSSAPSSPPLVDRDRPPSTSVPQVQGGGKRVPTASPETRLRPAAGAKE